MQKKQLKITKNSKLLSQRHAKISSKCQKMAINSNNYNITNYGKYAVVKIEKY